MPPLAGMLAVLLLLVVTVPTAGALDAHGIVGCGGFVEASAELSRLRAPGTPRQDLSFIKVELRTTEGMTKYTTECAPNGYYFIPVYDKGTFVVKVDGPAGWSFSPDAVTTAVDSHGCHSGKDINFVYTGFSLTGKVLGPEGGASCQTDEPGPAGVTVVAQSPKVRVTTETLRGATYTFTNLLPDLYEVEASHPTWTVTGKAVAEVTWEGKTEVPATLRVLGYDVRGHVLSQGNPMLGVNLFLYSNDVKSVECENPNAQGPRGTALCQTTSNEKGEFKFSAVPCGRYNLVPNYQGEHTVFDVAPSALDITVGHGSLVLTTSFEVTGFSIGGRVVDTAGAGISGVSVYIDGVGRAVTTASGSYQVDQVMASTYTIIARKPHYEFSKLDRFMILPSMASLPDLKPTALDVCGAVQVEDKQFSNKRQVTITGPAGFKPLRKATGEDGRFCFQVAPGTYAVAPVVTAEEKNAGLLLSPPQQELVIGNEPVTDLLFLQALVTVSGHINCLVTPCPGNIAVKLQPMRGSSDAIVTVTPGKAAINPDMFRFDSVPPGKYKLIAKKDGWCWSDDGKEIVVGATDVQVVQLTQEGFLVDVEASHNMMAKLTYGTSIKEVSFQRGKQSICVGIAGTFEIKPQGCYKLEQEVYTGDTTALKPISLLVTHYRVSGYITVPADYQRAEVAKSVKVQAAQDGVITTTTPVFTKSTLEYTYFVRPGRVILQPVHSELLFFPKSRIVQIDGLGCEEIVPSFDARVGVFVQGMVTPHTAGVQVAVKVGDDVVANATTDANGMYRVGPLLDGDVYKVSATKDGFHITQTEGYNFWAQHLAQLTVVVADEGGVAMPGALLSLSRDNGYRNNTVTDNEGTLVFNTLYPGEYFLRPLLKEYTFAPATASFTLEDGEDKRLSFKGVRAAYSVYGAVVSLNGTPLVNIAVGALSLKSPDSQPDNRHYEEAVTDDEGKYRLRGLTPGVSYLIRPKLDGANRVERSSPSGTKISVKHEDTTGINFMAFAALEFATITGTVDVDDTWLPLVVVEAVNEATGAIEQVSLDYSRFFEFCSLQLGTYTIRTACTVPKAGYVLDNGTIHTNAQARTQHIGELKFTATLKADTIELAAAPIAPVVMAVVVLAVALNFSSIQSSLAYITNLLSSAASDKLVSKSKDSSRKEFSARKLSVSKRR
eukprot:jgi/Chlat1/5846/Chrsp4S06365